MYVKAHVRKIVATVDRRKKESARTSREVDVTLKIDVSNVFSYLQELYKSNRVSLEYSYIYMCMLRL